jgi:hypothetical protein
MFPKSGDCGVKGVLGSFWMMSWYCLVYLSASMVNSNVSKQWFCERYAVKALMVHGGDAVFDSISCKVGHLGQYGPVGIDRLKGLDGGKSPEDMKPSSSASQSERTDEQRGDVSLDDMWMCNDGGFRIFDLRIALRRYFMGTLAVRPLRPPPQTDCCVLQNVNFTRVCV